MSRPQPPQPGQPYPRGYGQQPPRDQQQYRQPSQPGYGHQHTGQGYVQQNSQPQRYDQQAYAEPQAPRRRSPEPTARRRRVWPWVLLTIIMVPILGFAACTALVGGAISSVDEARKGGTVAIGQTFTYKSGLALSASAPKAYKSDNQFIVAAGEAAYESTVTITNGTDKPVGTALITMNATVNNTPAQQVFDGAGLTTQDIAPGRQLKVPFRFKVPKGTTGALQIAVTDTFNEAVFFTGKMR